MVRVRGNTDHRGLVVIDPRIDQFAFNCWRSQNSLRQSPGFAVRCAWARLTDFEVVLAELLRCDAIRALSVAF